jgi:hypothetical protein
LVVAVQLGHNQIVDILLAGGALIFVQGQLMPLFFAAQEGRPLPPESSFGRLHRASPERLLAKDLRDAVCPAAGPCPLLNASGWRPGASP